MAGHPSIDRLYEIDVLRPGQVHRPGVARAVPGGKGLNVARAICNLGGDAHVLAILAGHAGRWIADALEAEGVPGTFVWTAGETRTSVSIAASSSPGTPLTEFYEESTPIAPEAWSELEVRASDLLGRSKLLCLSGSLIPGAPKDGYRRAADLAHEKVVPVALDSHGPQFLEALNAHPELIKINADEAGAALAASPPERDLLAWATLAAAELRLLAGGNSTCVVTCGTSGMALVDESGHAYRGQLEQVGNYPVGSGDAALAALSLAYVEGRTPHEALPAALGAGAANAEVPGPGTLDGARAHALAERVSVERFKL